MADIIYIIGTSGLMICIGIVMIIQAIKDRDD
jgi:hypothetical protein